MGKADRRRYSSIMPQLWEFIYCLTAKIASTTKFFNSWIVHCLSQHKESPPFIFGHSQPFSQASRWRHSNRWCLALITPKCFHICRDIFAGYCQVSVVWLLFGRVVRLQIFFTGALFRQFHYLCYISVGSSGFVIMCKHGLRTIKHKRATLQKTLFQFRRNVEGFCGIYKNGMCEPDILLSNTLIRRIETYPCSTSTEPPTALSYHPVSSVYPRKQMVCLWWRMSLSLPDSYRGRHKYCFQDLSLSFSNVSWRFG